MPRLVTASADEATVFFEDALAHGHEGVVVKSLIARRGRPPWRRVDQGQTSAHADLVVLAVEWGHGRRRGWLSNLHLGARDPATADSSCSARPSKGSPTRC